METNVVKICLSEKCRARGSKGVLSALENREGLPATIEKTDQCMGYCGMGPNVAVNGNILHHMRPDEAKRRVEEELLHPSPKIHGLGSKKIDDLDSILDSF